MEIGASAIFFKTRSTIHLGDLVINMAKKKKLYFLEDAHDNAFTCQDDRGMSSSP